MDATESRMSASESFVIHDPSISEKDEIDSLPSISSSILDSEDDDDSEDAQAEWERSIGQLQLLLGMVIVPFVGKYLGRKFAYWSWARYMEWMHNVEVVWSNKKAFKAVGAVEAAVSL